MTYIYSNLIGSFVISESLQSEHKFEIKECKKFKNLKEFLNKDKIEKQLVKKNSKSKVATAKEAQQFLGLFNKPEYFDIFRERNFSYTRQLIKESINEDNLIVQTISNINDLDKTNNLLAKHLRDWFDLFLPELSESTSNHEAFTNLVLEKSRTQLLKELKLKEEDSMGKKLDKNDIEEIKLLAKQLKGIYELRSSHEEYLEKLMKKYCPNLLELAGVTIGAKLFDHGKSLKRLALLPSSTIQLFGAEKALFRHMKTGAPSPKYGVIFTHPLVQRSRRKNQGIMARMLASKLSLAVKIDFFKGKFIADKMKEDLDKKFNKLNS